MDAGVNAPDFQMVHGEAAPELGQPDGHQNGGDGSVNSSSVDHDVLLDPSLPAAHGGRSGVKWLRGLLTGRHPTPGRMPSRGSRAGRPQGTPPHAALFGALDAEICGRAHGFAAASQSTGFVDHDRHGAGIGLVAIARSKHGAAFTGIGP